MTRKKDPVLAEYSAALAPKRLKKTFKVPPGLADRLAALQARLTTEDAECSESSAMIFALEKGLDAKPASPGICLTKTYHLTPDVVDRVDALRRKTKVKSESAAVILALSSGLDVLGIG